MSLGTYFVKSNNRDANTQIHNTLSRLGTDTSIKSGGGKLIIVKMMRPCK